MSALIRKQRAERAFEAGYTTRRNFPTMPDTANPYRCSPFGVGYYWLLGWELAGHQYRLDQAACHLARRQQFAFAQPVSTQLLAQPQGVSHDLSVA